MESNYSSVHTSHQVQVDKGYKNENNGDPDHGRGVRDSVGDEEHLDLETVSHKDFSHGLCPKGKTRN